MNSELVSRIIQAGALELRSVPEKVANEEVDSLPIKHQPFLYASGNWGPGYVSIKGLVALRSLFEVLVSDLADLLREKEVRVDFVVGNATGGMIPGWVLSKELRLPYVYARETRKKGGQKEIVTGLNHVPQGRRGLIVEELVNFAESTCNSVEALRNLGYIAVEAATILFYDNPEAVRKLESEDIRITYLLTLRDLLVASEESYPAELVLDYRSFLQDPLGWQSKRGLKPIEKGGTR